MLKTKSAFTLVELLIVIVVIAILAAITIVAYNGVQDRANNTAVQSDLSTFGKKIELYKIENNGEYPAPSDLGNVGMKLSRGSYDTDVYNVYYCVKIDYSEYAVAAKTKSGVTYYVSSDDNGTISGSPNPSWQVACGVIDITDSTQRLFTDGYNKVTGVWADWT